MVFLAPAASPRPPPDILMATAPICDFGWRAVDFDLPATDGKRYRLAQLQGPHGLLVMFICNHCPYVKAVIDRIVRDTKELQEHGVASVAISANDPSDYPEDSFDNMKRVAAQKRFPLPLFVGRVPGCGAGLRRCVHSGLLRFQPEPGVAVSRPAGRLSHYAGPRRQARPVRGHAADRAHRQRPRRADFQHGLLDQVETTRMNARQGERARAELLDAGTTGSAMLIQ